MHHERSRGPEDGQLSNRFYRRFGSRADLVCFRVIQKQTDLLIGVSDRSWRTHGRVAEMAREAVLAARREIEDYLGADPGFAAALAPHAVPAGAPGIVRRMADAAEVAGVGPMAAIAGAVAERVGWTLCLVSPEVIVENGGDVFMQCDRRRLVGVFAGRSRFSGRLAVVIEPGETPVSVCTSSRTVGPSLSFGHADAALVKAQDAALADAAATAVGNMVLRPGDVQAAAERGCAIPGVLGVVVISGDEMAVAGGVTLCGLDGGGRQAERR